MVVANTFWENFFLLLIFLPLAIILTRVESSARKTAAPIAVDLFYSVILFLLVAALVLGSFVVKQVSGGNYPLALAQTLFAIAVLLVTLSWLWNPRSGFVGIGHLLSRYLMSLGLPFEQWVQRLAEFAERESQPQRFLALALQHVLELPWVNGVEWDHSRHGQTGCLSQYTSFPRPTAAPSTSEPWRRIRGSRPRSARSLSTTSC